MFFFLSLFHHVSPLQVPTECDVEMTTVRSRSLHASPVRSRPRLDDYRSPTFCDTEEYFINAETGEVLVGD